MHRRKSFFITTSYPKYGWPHIFSPRVDQFFLCLFIMNKCPWLFFYCFIWEITHQISWCSLFFFCWNIISFLTMVSRETTLVFFSLCIYSDYNRHINKNYSRYMILLINFFFKPHLWNLSLHQLYYPIILYHKRWIWKQSQKILWKKKKALKPAGCLLKLIKSTIIYLKSNWISVRIKKNKKHTYIILLFI